MLENTTRYWCMKICKEFMKWDNCSVQTPLSCLINSYEKTIKDEILIFTSFHSTLYSSFRKFNASSVGRNILTMLFSIHFQNTIKLFILKKIFKQESTYQLQCQLLQSTRACTVLCRYTSQETVESWSIVLNSDWIARGVILFSYKSQTQTFFTFLIYI